MTGSQGDVVIVENSARARESPAEGAVRHARKALFDLVEQFPFAEVPGVMSVGVRSDLTGLTVSYVDDEDPDVMRERLESLRLPVRIWAAPHPRFDSLIPSEQ